MNLGCGAVQRNSQADHARFLHFEDGFAGQQRRSAGRNRHFDILFGGIADQLIDVGAFEGVAAGKDKDGHLHPGDLVDESFALVGAQLFGVGDRLGGGPAVFAGEITGLRDLPDCQKGSLVEIQSTTSGNVVHRLHVASIRSR